MPRTTVNSRVQKYRETRRMADLRLVQIWVPDTRHPDFGEECRRQSFTVAQADKRDPTLTAFMNGALADIEGWTE